MKCKVVENNLIEYIEETLSDELGRELSVHISNCDNCRKLFENVRATYQIRNGINENILEVDLYQRLKNKLDSKQLIRSHVHVLSPAIWQPVAAVILILVGIALGILLGRQIPLAMNQSTTVTLKSNSDLNTYATEYYLDGTQDENLDYLISNE